MWLDLRSLWETSGSTVAASGNAIGSAIALGDLQATGALAGTAIASSLATGQEVGSESYSGNAIASSEALGDLRAVGALSGTAIIESLAIADCEDAGTGPQLPTAPAETPAGRRTRYRNVYRVSVDGQKFEFKSLADALSFLDKAKEAAEKIAAEAVKKTAEAQSQAAFLVHPPALAAPKIGISSRELRKAAAQTKRQIEVIYQAAARDAEIAALFELMKREEDDDALILLI